MKADKINLYRDSFTTEKILNYAPTLVYTVWSKVEHKRNWFSENEVWETQEYRLDFRAGGSEYDRSIVKESGTEVIFDAHYLHCIDNQVIVYAYNTIIDGTYLSSSFSTVQFIEENNNTRLIISEHITAYGQPDDESERQRGWATVMKDLENYLGNL